LAAFVALKFLPEHFATNPQALERFQRSKGGLCVEPSEHPHVYEIGKYEARRSSPWNLWTARR